MKLKAAGIAALILALFALWLLLRGEHVEPEVEAPAPLTTAAVEPQPAAPVIEREAAAPAPTDVPPPTAAAPAELSLSFTDILSGELLAPAAVVLLEAAGPRVLTANAAGAFALPAEPSVIAATFAAHMPICAVLRPESGTAALTVNVFPAAPIRFEFEGCDASLIPAGTQISLGFEDGMSILQRPDHGQSHYFRQRILLWGRRHGRPDLSLAPASWFSAAQAEEWREGALRHLKTRGSSVNPAVSAMTLAVLPLDHEVTGNPIVIEGAPAGLEFSWRTALPLQQLAPASERGVQTTQEGGRSGRFGITPGGVTVRLAWAAAASIRGRIPLEGLQGELLPPLARLSGVERGGPNTPVSGTLTGRNEAAVNPQDGSFEFLNLAPGEFQLDVGWSKESDIFMSSSRILLEAGQQLDVGICPVAAGSPLSLKIELRDLLGQPLLPTEVFLPDHSPRGVVRVHQSTRDPLEPSPYLELDLPYAAEVQLHGLRPGFIFTSPALDRPDPAELQPGVSYARTEVEETRITFPEVQEVRVRYLMQKGTVPVTIHFEYPQEALEHNHVFYLTHLASGTKIPTHELHEALRPRQLSTTAVIGLLPGEYEALLLSNGASMAKPGEVHHYAFATISVENDGRPVTLKLEPGLQARGPANAAELRTVADSAFFMLRSVGGVAVQTDAIIVGKYGADGNFTMYGVPPGAVLQQNRDPVSWVVSEAGVLTPVQ